MRSLPHAPSGAVALILGVTLMHLFEATVLLTTTVADGSVPMHALLMAFGGDRVVAGLTMYACVLPTLYSLRHGPTLRPGSVLACLIPQFVLLVVTSLGAEIAVIRSEYADHVARSMWFILTDQFHRIFLPLIYAFSAIDHFNLSLRRNR